MKTLKELRMEIEIGLWVYPSNNHDVDVHFQGGWYIFGYSDNTPEEKEDRTAQQVMVTWEGDVIEREDFTPYTNGVIYDGGYRSLDALIADWPELSSLPVWSVTKTLERERYDKGEREKGHWVH